MHVRGRNIDLQSDEEPSRPNSCQPNPGLREMHIDIVIPFTNPTFGWTKQGIDLLSKYESI